MKVDHKNENIFSLEFEWWKNLGTHNKLFTVVALINNQWRFEGI